MVLVSELSTTKEALLIASLFLDPLFTAAISNERVATRKCLSDIIGGCLQNASKLKPAEIAALQKIHGFLLKDRDAACRVRALATLGTEMDWLGFCNQEIILLFASQVCERCLDKSKSVRIKALLTLKTIFPRLDPSAALSSAAVQTVFKLLAISPDSGHFCKDTVEAAGKFLCSSWLGGPGLYKQLKDSLNYNYGSFNQSVLWTIVRFHLADYQQWSSFLVSASDDTVMKLLRLVEADALATFSVEKRMLHSAFDVLRRSPHDETSCLGACMVVAVFANKTSKMEGALVVHLGRRCCERLRSSGSDHLNKRLLDWAIKVLATVLRHDPASARGAAAFLDAEFVFLKELSIDSVVDCLYNLNVAHGITFAGDALCCSAAQDMEAGELVREFFETPVQGEMRSHTMIMGRTGKDCKVLIADRLTHNERTGETGFFRKLWFSPNNPTVGLALSGHGQVCSLIERHRERLLSDIASLNAPLDTGFSDRLEDYMGHFWKTVIGKDAQRIMNYGKSMNKKEIGRQDADLVLMVAQQGFYVFCGEINFVEDNFALCISHSSEGKSPKVVTGSGCGYADAATELENRLKLERVTVDSNGKIHLKYNKLLMLMIESLKTSQDGVHVGGGVDAGVFLESDKLNKKSLFKHVAKMIFKKDCCTEGESSSVGVFHIGSSASWKFRRTSSGDIKNGPWMDQDSSDSEARSVDEDLHERCFFAPEGEHVGGMFLSDDYDIRHSIVDPESDEDEKEGDWESRWENDSNFSVDHSEDRL